MRLYTTITIITLLLLLSGASLSAQETSTQIQDLDLKGVVRDYIRAGRTINKKLVKGQRARTGDDLPFEKIGISLGSGSLDLVSVQVSTPINEMFKIRAGIGFMPGIVSVNKQIAIKDEALRQRVLGFYNPDYDVDFKPSFINGHILASYYPIVDVPFHVTAGLYIGSNKMDAKGQLRDPRTGEKTVLMDPNLAWPLLDVEGYAMNIDAGKLDAEIEMGFLIKPYLGAGYGYVVPDTDWSFNVDLGLIYQGGYKIHQFGKEAPKTVAHKSSAIDISKYTNMVKVWPVLSVQVSYRIY